MHQQIPTIGYIGFSMLTNLLDWDKVVSSLAIEILLRKEKFLEIAGIGCPNEDYGRLSPPVHLACAAVQDSRLIIL